MEFKFRYGKREFVSFGLYRMLWLLRGQWLIYLSQILIIHIFFKIHMVFLLTLIVISLAVSAAMQMKALFYNVDIQVEIKDGAVIVAGKNGTSHYSCDKIVNAKKRGSLIWIELDQAARYPVAILVPCRAFASPLEQLGFMEYLSRQSEYAIHIPAGGWRDKAAGDGSLCEHDISAPEFSMRILWDKELLWQQENRVAWIKSQKGFAGTGQWPSGIYLTVFLTGMLLASLLSENGSVLRLFIFGGLVIMVHCLNKRILKEKRMETIAGKRQPPCRVKHGRYKYSGDKSRGDKFGEDIKAQVLSQIWMRDRGIYIWNGNRTERIVCWEELRSLQEFREWFFLLDDRKDIMVYFPMDALGNAEEQTRFIEYCKNRGLEYHHMEEKYGATV